MSLRDRVLRFKFFTGRILFCLPLPGCFLIVCLPTFLAAVLKFFFPLTSATSGTANSNTSAPTGFAAGTIYFLRKGKRFSQKLAQQFQNYAPFEVHYLGSREVEECLMQPFYTLILIQMNVRNLRTSRVISTETKGIFSPEVSRKSMCML